MHDDEAYLATALPGARPFPDDLRARIDTALAERSPDDVPRTRHRDGVRPHFTNRLIFETSPYLRQHAHNPVNWYPWGDEAFEEARAQREAGLSVDRIFDVSLVSRDGGGVVRGHRDRAHPQRAVRRHQGRPRRASRRRYRLHDRGAGADAARRLADERLARRAATPVFRRHVFSGARRRARRTDVVSQSILRELADLYRVDAAARRSRCGLDHARDRRRDGRRGRRARRRRVPACSTRRWTSTSEPTTPCTAVCAARRSSRRACRCGCCCAGIAVPATRPSLEMATHTLEMMAAGGMHDQLAGGFHRYSTDERWLVPHFEKMLYDNALLALAYAEAWQVTQAPRLRARRCARRSITCCAR